MSNREQDHPGTVDQLPSTQMGSELSVDLGTMQAITKAELEQNIATARQYPRSLTSFQRDCRSMATLTPDVAQECFYSLPARRGGDGKPIDGPSVRLAEIVVSAWGNCRAGSRVLEEGRDFIVAQGIFHDLERGTVISTEIRRRIVGSNGRRYGPDMISVTANAACSIAMRNAVFKGVPKALWNSIYKECRAVVRGDVKTLVTRRAEAIETLSKMGASKQQIFDALEVKGAEDIGLDELVQLGGWTNAIREGEATFEEVFAPKADEKPAGQNRIDQAKGALASQAAVPQFDEASARAAITGAASLAALEEKWRAVVADYKARGLAIPIELEAARNDRRSALEG